MKGKWETYQSDYTGIWHVCFLTTKGIYPDQLDFEIGQMELAISIAEDLNRIEVKG